MSENENQLIKFNFHKNLLFLYLFFMAVFLFTSLSTAENDVTIHLIIPVGLMVTFAILAYYKYKYLMRILNKFKD